MTIKKPSRFSRFFQTKSQANHKNNKAILPTGAKISFSQTGEDVIAKFIFDGIGIPQPTYLDVGAYDPYEISNTALFYLNGCRGVNIEPDTELFEKYLVEKKEDVNLNMGVAGQKGELKFYKMSAPTLNTFSEAEAQEFVEVHHYKILSTHLIKVDTLPNIVEKYCGGVFPHFLSLDAEGLDLEILKSIDYCINAPIVICVETLSFSNVGLGVKNEELIKFLTNEGYDVFADTHINTIFVRKDRWRRGC